MDLIAQITPHDRAKIALFANRMKTKNLFPQEKTDMCCCIVSLVRAGMELNKIKALYPDLPPHFVYRVVFLARKAAVLPPFEALDQYRYRALVTDIKLGPMQGLARACGPDLLHWVARNTPDGATVVEFIAAILRDSMHEDQDKMEASK
tara:strand:+ start:236 stop:682 length:447 start_codon:yes stop_codon:yes gene_type:complete